jgi:putative mRNA 3-end processing factor
MNDFLQMRPEGLYFQPGDFYLDPQLPVRHALVSHAHADHYISGHQHVYCTPLTHILHAKRNSDSAAVTHLFGFHEAFKVNNCSVSFAPAGHILGSAQILFEHNGLRYLYTGDFKQIADTTCEPLEYIKADVLITESTFASEGLKHPDPEQEISKINAFGDLNIIIGAYPLGKAQRLIALINKCCPDRTLMVHKKISIFNHAYQNSGFDPGSWRPYNKREFRRNRNMVYLLPPMHAKSFYPQPWYARAFATGWDHLQTGFDFKLYISDHADWFDLINLIRMSGARHIYTVHGDGKALQKYFSAESIPVVNLN